MTTTKKRSDKLFCSSCDSEFKLIYVEEDVSRYPTTCPFCAEELDFETDNTSDDEKDDSDDE